MSFELANAADVQVEVFNVVGEQVAYLNEGTLPSGTNNVQIDLNNNLSSGLYIVRLSIDGNQYSQNLMISK